MKYMTLFYFLLASFLLRAQQGNKQTNAFTVTGNVKNGFTSH